MQFNYLALETRTEIHQALYFPYLIDPIQFKRYEEWQYLGLMLKGPGLKSSVLHILVMKRKFLSDDDNIGPKLKKDEVCNFEGVKYVQRKVLSI